MGQLLLDSLPDLYHRRIVASGKQPQFFVLLAFLTMFLIVRVVTHAIRSGRVPFVRNVRLVGRTSIISYSASCCCWSPDTSAWRSTARA
jgi:hypothetical protein